MKKIFKNIPSQQNYVQTNCSNVTPMLFKQWSEAAQIEIYL